MTFFLNPKRKKVASFKEKIKRMIQSPFISLGLWCGFLNIEYSYVHGYKERLSIGKGCSTANTIFNTVSGAIHVGADTIFGHNCMVLTGLHRFYDGKRAKLSNNRDFQEVPNTGYDIAIGSGCFIGSGTIIVGGVTIGDNVIVGAGSVVTKNVPSGCFVAGVPAKIVKSNDLPEKEVSPDVRT